MSAAPSGSAPSGSAPLAPRRRDLLMVALVLLIGALGAGAVIMMRAASQYSGAVVHLQRAPVGCDTEFDFTGTGTFTFYVETAGRIGALRGDCPNTETAYERPSGSALPEVVLTLVDADGATVSLDRTSDASYDVGGFSGTSVRSLTISEPGSYVLSVSSEDTDFVISVGRDPKSNRDQLRLIGLVVAIAGLSIAGVVAVLGLRRRAAPPADGGGGAYGAAAAPPPAWAPVVYPPAPVQPGIGQPGTGLPAPTWEPPHPSG
ncbi:unannotated protein [freshwater metagenome]|uniref:Unannotated protein n=1 Tax=freshwater metagenome TaxID=449393 RepID=A0A6J7EWD2_9ZZZZ|nr:hypothetical protein [Actinomycetota bacterium]